MPHLVSLLNFSPLVQQSKGLSQYQFTGPEIGRKTGKSLGKRLVVGNVASDKSAVSGETVGMICLWLFVHTTFVKSDGRNALHQRVSLGLVSAEHNISPTGTPHIQTELKLSRPTFPGRPSSTVLGQPSGY